MKNAHPNYDIRFLSTCMCNYELTAFRFGSQRGEREVQTKANKKRW